MRYYWWDAAQVNAFITCKEMECGKEKKGTVAGEITQSLFDVYPTFFIDD